MDIVLTDVDAYNPSAEDDCISALQQLQHVNLSLLAELRSNKDASVEVLTKLLLVLPLSLALDVSNIHVKKIRENIADYRSTLCNVFVPLAEPFSIVVLRGTEGTSEAAPRATMVLSTTFASASSIPPISIDDYEVTHADDQEGAGADADPFPNVDDADLNIP
ncbi:hypothetical protein Tco_0216727 [Tanacetum coccineum]